MTEHEPPEDDPFSDADDAAREREARRREREARRKTTEGQGVAPRDPEGQTGPAVVRESIASRVSGILAGLGTREDDSDAEAPGEAVGAGPPIAEREFETAFEPTSAGSQRAGSGDGLSLIWRRRIAAVAGLVGVIVVLVLAINSLGGGEEPLPAPEPTPEFTVTVPEGLTREQIADRNKIVGSLKGDYVKRSRTFKGFDPGEYGAEKPDSLEGFLFPDTYSLFEGSNVKDLIGRQLDAFVSNYATVNTKRAKEGNLTDYEVVIIASMIEKEIAVDSERRLAAAAIYNRLRDGEPLGIDATIRFALDKYDGQLTESDLLVDSPFNTRTNAGLPPAPIANPGLASLKAAAKPAQSDVRYYVIKPGTCNEHFFTADLAEFNAASAEYQAALAAEGGSPTKCP